MTPAPDPPPGTEWEIAFGEFRFLPESQQLLRGALPVRLGSRALAILGVLLERPGELVGKRELLARAWPGSVVEEANLKVNVAALRRALGDSGQDAHTIATVSGRGYRFAAPVSRRPLAPAVAALDLPASPHAIGRDEAIASVAQLLAERRFVTIAGPGGIGKTTVARAVAQALRAQGADTCLVDLSPLPDQRFVGAALATALGLSLHSREALPALLACLRERPMLLVLDSCEHVLDSAAGLAESLVAGAPQLQLLATSREPLRAGGEVVHRLGPLACPPEGEDLSAARALDYPAVRLFVERAADCMQGYRLGDEDAPAVAEICRRLEGIALAIELAATRMDAFGARSLAAHLDDRFRLLQRGRRGAQARHRTLEAALDWSYAFLPFEEQAILRATAVFARSFTLDAAAALCTGSEADALAIVDAVADLVAKSLLVAEAGEGGDGRWRYRMLGTTRAYALDKLEASGEGALMRRRHAELQRALFERAAAEWEARPADEWLAEHGAGIDDVRLALAWASAPGGDRALAVALTVAAIPLWMHLSLLDECRAAVETALRGDAADGGPGEREEMKLNAALAAAILYAHGPRAETAAAWSRALALAERLDDGEYRLRALWGLAVHHTYAGEHRSALELARRFRAAAAARGDRAARVSGGRMVATALHYLGRQDAARSELDDMLARYVAPVHRSHIARFQLDQRAAALGTLANVLWLQGRPGKAAEVARQALASARASGHALSLLNALVHAAIPVALYTGDYRAAEDLLDELLDHLARHALTVWESQWRCLRGVALLQQGGAQGIELLAGALEELGGTGFRLRLSGHQGVLALALGQDGRAQEGLALLEAALAACERGGEAWCVSELLRIKGELLASENPAAARRCYRRALALARAQGALSWELRSATSLALLDRRLGRRAGGRVLAAVLARFEEADESVDLRRAALLLASCRADY